MLDRSRPLCHPASTLDAIEPCAIRPMYIPEVTSSHLAPDGGSLYLASSSGTAGWSSITGIVTAIVGNILISFALNTQRYAHVRLDREYSEKRGLSLKNQSANQSLGYGATDQERLAEERSKANATASGPVGPLDEDRSPGSADDEDASRHLQDSFRSDHTIKPGEKDEEDEEGKKTYLKSPIWWLGITLMTVGETGNFLAYGFAPASIVSPLGVVALISNCLIAPMMLKEKFRKRDAWGVLIAIAGAVTVVLSAKQSEKKVDPDELWDYYIKRWEFLVYVIVTAVCILGLMFASPRYGTRTILIDLGLVGLFGGYTALSTKGVASLLSTELWKAFAYPILYVLVLILVASAIMQIRYLNKALQNFNSTQVIPTQFVLFTLSVIVGSAVLFREFESTTPDRAIKFIAGCLLTFFGVYLITSNRPRSDDSEKEGYEDQDEEIHLIDGEGERVDERTPLNVDKSRRRSSRTSTSHSATPKASLSHTPPRSPSRQPSGTPSIALTPASTISPSASPWKSSAEQLPPLPPRPQTPMNRSHSDLTGTPFYTPATSRPFQQRSQTSVADPQTPTRSARTASPPKPDRSAVMAAEADGGSALGRSARNSIHRLLPGPLLPPLSSSLSGIVHDSLRRGEGSPLAVRERLRRNRLRSGTVGRRRSIAPGDEEAALGVASSDLPPGLGGNEPASESAPDVQDVVEGAGSTSQKRSRLRAMSEAFGSYLG